MADEGDRVTEERALALKGSIRLLAEYPARPEEERRELAEFAVELVDRVVNTNGTNGAADR